MQDNEQDNIEIMSDNEEVEECVEEKPVQKEPKSKKGLMTPAKKLANEKARATRLANLEEAKKSGVISKPHTRMSKKEFDEMVEKRAQELIEKKKMEKELAEYRKLKKEQALLAKKKVEEPEEIPEEPAPKKENYKESNNTQENTSQKKPAPKKKKPVASDSDEDEEPAT